MSQLFSPISEQDVRTTSTTQGGNVLGEYGGTQDGRLYRFGKAGAVALAPGKVAVSEATAANHTNRAVASAVGVGEYTVTFTLGATAAAADLYKDGYLNVNDAAGEGCMYRIEGHPAVLSGGSMTVTLAEPVKVALTTSSEVSLVKQTMDDLIVNPGAVAHNPVGVNNVTVPIDGYGWFQVRGLCSTLSDGIVTKGAGAISSDAVAGAVEIEVAATVTRRIGVAPEATVDTEYYPLDLCIA
jgi:hypothetical protein